MAWDVKFSLHHSLQRTVEDEQKYIEAHDNKYQDDEHLILSMKVHKLVSKKHDKRILPATMQPFTCLIMSGKVDLLVTGIDKLYYIL